MFTNSQLTNDDASQTRRPCKKAALHAGVVPGVVHYILFSKHLSPSFEIVQGVKLTFIDCAS